MPRPRLAATTVLLHERGGLPEVLLVRRPASMAAFADMWVFPGGQVDAQDDGELALAAIDSRARAHATQLVLAPAAGDPDPPLLPLFTAACRELFEEVGVLLSAPAEGRDALLARRPAMLVDGGVFYRALVALGLPLRLERLLPWSRWITPPGAPRRFDTLFFVAAVEGRELAPEAREIAAACWLPVDEAIREGLEGSRRLMTPTVLTLMQIAAAYEYFGSLPALLASAAAGPLTAVHPRNVEVDGQPWIVLPWDEQAGEPRIHAWRTSGCGRPVPGRLRAAY